VVPVEFVFNVFNELCDRDRPCNSVLETRKKQEDNSNKKNFNFVSGQIFEMIILGDYSKMVSEYFHFTRITTLHNSYRKSCRNTISIPRTIFLIDLKPFD